jgi:hypothetical protein
MSTLSLAAQPLTAAPATLRAAGGKTRGTAAAQQQSLPSFVGEPVTFTGVVKKVMWRDERGTTIMTVQVPPDTWKAFKPLLQHKDLPSNAAMQRAAARGGGGPGSKAGIAAWNAQRYKLAHRCVSVRGRGMARLVEGCTCRMSGVWSHNERHGLEVQVDAWAELAATDPVVLKEKLQRNLAGVGPATAAQLVDSLGLQVRAGVCCCCCCWCVDGAAQGEKAVHI